MIFFPGAHLTEEQHLAFGARFGTPSVFPIAKLRGATEPTMTVITDAPGQKNAADAWHTDVTWSPTPPKAALLQALEVPERGGDTLWCSATAAYDALVTPVPGPARRTHRAARRRRASSGPSGSRATTSPR